LEDKRDALPVLETPALENYKNINSLGFSERARAHLLRDLAKESDIWENDDDCLKERYELATYDFEISLYTQKELSLRDSLERPAEVEEIANIPQPSPPMAAVEPEEIIESSPIKVSTSHLQSAVTDVSLGSPREEEGDVNQRQQVTRDTVVFQTILHYTTTSPIG